MLVKKTIALLALSLVFTCALPVVRQTYNTAYASEAGGKGEPALNSKIDTKNLSGIDLMIANLYNNDRVMYAVVVTLVMAVLGTTLALCTDFVLKMFGMEVSRISHRE